MNKFINAGLNPKVLDFWILLLRITVGLIMLTHGMPKLEKLLDGNMQFADPFGIGQGASLILTVFAEVLCSILILIGLGTRLATIPLIITMLVAMLVVHANDPLNKKELSILYLAIYITILVVGAGRYSIDHLISKKRYR